MFKFFTQLILLMFLTFITVSCTNFNIGLTIYLLGSTLLALNYYVPTKKVIE